MKTTKSKNVLRNIVHIFWISLLIISCKKEDVPTFTPPLIDNSLPSAAVYNVRLNNKSNNKLTFTIDLAVFKDSKNVENGFSANHFWIDTLAYDEVAFKTVSSSLSPVISPTNYSALLLMDQSGSISDTDPDDYRIDAGKIFCRNMGNTNNAWVWWFSDTYKAMGTDFTTDTAALIKNIEELRGSNGGNTSLYSSQITAINSIAQKADKPKKALLTFSDGEDSGYSNSNKDVVDAAKAKNVTLYNIGLGESSDTYLYDQAYATGGAFMFAKDAPQLISLFGNLGKLVDKSARFYSVQFEATTFNDSEFGNSGTSEFILKVLTPYNYTIEIPLSVTY